MRRSTAALAAASLIVITALALAGCTSWFESPGKPANDAIGVANGHLQTAASIDATVSANVASLQGVPYTAAGAKDALKLTAAIATELASERKELIAAKAAMDGIATLEVEAALKEYAALESTSIDARIALADGEARLYAGFDRLFSSLSGALKGVDNQEMITAIQSMQQEVAALSESASAAAKTASDFFATNKLGG
jgi:hypothetical protein